MHYTTYANKKFDILNKYKVYYTKELLEDVVADPKNTGKKGKLFFAEKDGIKVLYAKEGCAIKIFTFYPTKK